MAGIRFDCYKIGRYQNNMYIIYPYIFCLISIQLFLNERFLLSNGWQKWWMGVYFFLVFGFIAYVRRKYQPLEVSDEWASVVCE